MVQSAIHPDELADRLRVLAAARRPRQTEAELRGLLDQLSNREVVEALFSLSNQELADLMAQLQDEIVAELLAEMEPMEGARLLLRLSRVRAADVLEEFEPDSATPLSRPPPTRTATPPRPYSRRWSRRRRRSRPSTPAARSLRDRVSAC